MNNDSSKQRFKGVENFLRRVAFNLGNSPSQTEVKIISCIPIDVTDLQQKILQLEKQLEAAKCSVVHTTICNRAASNHSNGAFTCKGINCDQSGTSLRYSKTEQNQAQDGCVSSNVSEKTDIEKCLQSEWRKSFFSKRSKIPKKKFKTQCVYYAQTENETPFNKHRLAFSKNTAKEKNNSIKQSYLSDMIRRQYKPQPISDATNGSEFSTPVCTDFIDTQKNQNSSSDYELCSCCHGKFHNIDNYMKKQEPFNILSSHNDTRNLYYDSNLYDVVPVKENVTRDSKKQKFNQGDIAYWPESMRPRYKIPSITVNHHTITPARQHIIKKVQLKSPKVSKKEDKIKPTIRKQQFNNVSKTKSVEVSEVYTKKVQKKRQPASKLTPSKTKNRSDAARLTTLITNTECQTTLQSNVNSRETKKEGVTNTDLPEDKTEMTLNQIKNILQSVLTEVKTKSKSGNTSDLTRRDAVVQNGPSQSNLCCGSSLLHSFSYSPYNMKPYVASCSQQMPTSSVYYPNMSAGPVKCLQHYPLFLPPGQNMCTSFYRQGPQVNKFSNLKRATSAATNTEQLRIRSKETENLIKEIYKSMALHIDVSSINIREKEHGDINKNNQIHNTRRKDREANEIAIAISEIFRNTNPIDTSVTQTTTPFDSKPVSNKTSFGSQPMNKNIRLAARKESFNHYSDDDRTETVDVIETEQLSRELESDDESDVTVVQQEESESSVSETESDSGIAIMATVSVSKKKEKKGLLSKMLEIFKPRSRNRKKKASDGSDNKYLDSDSDYYQNVYSHKVVTPKPTPKNYREQPYSKTVFSKQSQKPKNQSQGMSFVKSPYMEQEYRRHFNEKLTFHDNREGKLTMRDSVPQKRPVYYQKLEARSVMEYPTAHETRMMRGYGTRQNPQILLQKKAKSLKQNAQVQNQVNSKRIPSIPPLKILTVPPKTKAWLKKYIIES